MIKTPNLSSNLNTLREIEKEIDLLPEGKVKENIKSWAKVCNNDSKHQGLWRLGSVTNFCVRNAEYNNPEIISIAVKIEDLCEKIRKEVEEQMAKGIEKFMFVVVPIMIGMILYLFYNMFMLLAEVNLNNFYM